MFLWYLFYKETIQFYASVFFIYIFYSFNNIYKLQINIYKFIQRETAKISVGTELHTQEPTENVLS